MSLRIACYGFAEHSAGSVSSAGFVVLDELLRRGHQIEFFGKTSFFRPRGLEHHANFRFVEVPEPRADRVAGWLRSRKAGIVSYIATQLAHRGFAANIMGEMRRAHRVQRFDVQLLLGDWAWGRVSGVPVLSWVQGPPETDARSISRRRKELIQLCGWKTYLPMRLFALYRRVFGLPQFAMSDILIVGSQWSLDRLATYGVSRAKTTALPYPIDLTRFTPNQSRLAETSPLVLWIGRTVPRKRLDLFLDACDLLIKRGSNLRVMIVGGFGRFTGYQRLIDEFQQKQPDRLTYVSHIERDQIVSLIQSATVLVQPSEDENFGSAVAESLACGTPVVLGTTNGTGDYIDAGGIRFDRYEASAVADAINKAIESPSLRGAARKAAELHFDPSRITTALENFLMAAVTGMTCGGASSPFALRA